MSPEETLAIAAEQLKPYTLSEIEQAVLLDTLAGKKYEEIAISAKYDTSYIRDVGARVWRLFSQALGEKVTKKNIKAFLLELYKTSEIPATLNEQALLAARIQRPGDVIKPGSPQFIQHEQITTQLWQNTQSGGSLINLKSSAKMGKTCVAHSLLKKVKEADFNVVYIKLDQADYAHLSSIKDLLRWMLLNIEDQLHLSSQLDTYWIDEIGSKVNCTNYFQEFILAEITGPLMIVVDDLLYLHSFPTVFQEFLPMLRYWYERSSLEGQWEKLRLVLITNTERYVPLKLAFSPLNVGISIRMPCLSLEQVCHLDSVYRQAVPSLASTHILDDGDIQEIFKLVNGHPYLTHLTLHHLYAKNINWIQFAQEENFYQGIYNSFLRRKLSLVLQHERFLKCLESLLQHNTPMCSANPDIYQLQNIGIISFLSESIQFSCQLYAEYFSKYILNQESR